MAATRWSHATSISQKQDRRWPVSRFMMTTMTTKQQSVPSSSTPAGVFGPMAGDPRPALVEAGAVARRIMASVGPADVDRPSPAGMSVGDLTSHLVMAMRRAACLGHNEPFDTWPVDAPDVNIETAGAALDRALTELDEAWADDSILTAARPLPWATEALGAESLACYVSELIVHTWDLARAAGSGATGSRATWSDETIEVALAVMGVQLPVPERMPIWLGVAEQFDVPPEQLDQVAPFADAVPVSGDAPAIDRLVGWVGRNPSWPESS